MHNSLSQDDINKHALVAGFDLLLKESQVAGALPEHLRAFDDVDKTRELIYGNVISSLTDKFPYSDGKHRLELHNVKYSGPKEYTWAQQKKALISNKSLKTPVKGTWKLFDEETGEQLDEKEEVVMDVPYYTQRGTIVNNGNEYTVVNQSRLKPGVYTRTKQNGEHETQFNVKPGTGRGFRIWMEPYSGIFRVNVGQANIPAYPFLKMQGVSDEQMQKSWGDDVYNANVKKQDPQAVNKLYERFAGSKADKEATQDQKADYIREQLTKSELDERVVERTTGLVGTKTVTPELLLRTTNKLLNVNRREEDTDDRDAPEFSNILSVEDFVKERIDKDAGNTARQMLFNVRRDKNLGRVRRGALNSYMSSLLLGSGLASPTEETNPFQIMDQHNRIIKLGEGGISSAQTITDEARDVNTGQVGFIDPVAGPESDKVGIDVRASYKSFKGNDGQIYAEFLDNKGKKQYLKPEDMAGATVAFPGQDPKKQKYANVIKNGKLTKTDWEDVDYTVPSQAHMYFGGFNLTPLPTSFQPGRAFYASKYWSQYLPLKNGEVPLVQTQVPGEDASFSEHYGRKTAGINSKVGGIVTKVTDGGVTVTDEEGKKHFYETVKDFPFNRLTAISFSPKVKSGDVVKPGDMIAHSNFTDKETGAFNMGTNLKTAVVPYEGFSFEDAYVISESAAKKLETERLVGFDKTSRGDDVVNKNKFLSAFSKKFTADQYKTITDNGVVKTGTILKKGDPIILALGPKVLGKEDEKLGRLHKTLRNAFKDDSVVWESRFPGVVTDVGITNKGVKVNVKTSSPAQMGDKLANLAASKGVIGKIIPDDEMPKDQLTDEPYEMLLNPMVVQSRVAPNQLAEMQLAKIAKKTGKAYKLPSEAPEEGWSAFAKAELDKNGLSARNTVYDPVKGREIKNLGEGYMYMSAFHHLAEKKVSGRDMVGGYTDAGQPSKGGKTGAKKFSGMNLNAALAHGAHEVIKDATLIRGVKNEDYWNTLRSGRPLPEPETPFIYDKFMNTLNAGGINVDKKGDILSIMPMTNSAIDKISGGEIKNSRTVDIKNQDSAPGGLFDMAVTGGAGGNKWGHITLAEPIPNPVMEEPIRRVLGLKVKDFHDILAGKQELEGETGGKAIRKALGAIDVDKDIEKYTHEIKTARGARRDNAVKALRYLHAARKQSISPTDWILDKVPVIPPAFRPISQVGDMLKASDLNGLYRDVIETNNSIKDLREDLPEDELADEKIALYKSVTAAFGLGQPITPDGTSKNWKGAIRQVIGSNPKTGMLQSKVLSKTVNFVGRAVASPNPNYDMDTVGIPENKAWTIYRPFIIRSLVRDGVPQAKATEMVEDQDKVAKDALVEEMDKRPVIMDRAPTWHKFNLLAFKPKLVESDTIQVSPLIVAGFNMDFDGDAVNFHVPVSDKAVKQAWEKMTPSKNLFAVNDLKSPQHAISKEMAMGLYQLTRKAKNKKPVVFSSVEEAKKAYKEGLIDANDPIEIEGA